MAQRRLRGFESNGQPRRFKRKPFMVSDLVPLDCGIRSYADPENAPASIITRARDNYTTIQDDPDVGGVTNVASAADDPNAIENVVTLCVHGQNVQLRPEHQQSCTVSLEAGKASFSFCHNVFGQPPVVSGASDSDDRRFACIGQFIDRSWLFLTLAGQVFDNGLRTAFGTPDQSSS